MVASAEGRAATAMADHHHWFSTQPRRAVVGPHSPCSPVAPHSARPTVAAPRVPRLSASARRSRRGLSSSRPAAGTAAQQEERVSARRSAATARPASVVVVRRDECGDLGSGVFHRCRDPATPPAAAAGTARHASGRHSLRHRCRNTSATPGTPP